MPLFQKRQCDQTLLHLPEVKLRVLRRRETLAQLAGLAAAVALLHRRAQQRVLGRERVHHRPDPPPLIKADSIITRTSHYEGFNESGTGYILTAGPSTATAVSRARVNLG